MNTEKLEKLKKSLDNKFIPDNMKDKIRAEIKKLEADIKTDETITATEVKEEVKEIEKKVEKALEVAEEKEEKAEAKKEEAQEKAEAKAEEKKAKKSRTKTQKVEGKPKSAKKSVFSIAKEIRKDGETWEEAKDRARKMMKSETTETKKKTKTETQKLLAMVRRNKEYKKLAGTSDLPKDAQRRALPRGKRISKITGDVYYENRANRVDVGGFKNAYLAKGGEIEMENSNLYFVGRGRDVNGNKVIKISFPNQKPFSIQTLGNLPKTHRILREYDNDKDITPEEIATIEREIISYVEEFGSKKQKESLRKYEGGGYADKGVYVETLDEEIDLTDDGIVKATKTQQGGNKSFGERREMHGASPEALAFDNGGKVGRYSILGEVDGEQPVLYATTDDKERIKPLVNMAEIDLYELTGKNHRIFVTDEVTDDEVYHYGNGGRTRERRYVNHSQDYKVRYSKDKPHRRGYGYAGGGVVLDNVKIEVYKSFHGLKAENYFDDVNGYDWNVVTMKRHTGELVSSARGGKANKSEGNVEFFTFDYNSPNIKLISSRPSRVTEKVIEIQHSQALQLFKEKMEEGNFADGGTIIGTPETPLARGLDIDYTGLVGETGGMSSGELFAEGGIIKDGDKVVITTKSLGEKYLGMKGVVTSRKLLNDKYSIELENGMTLAFDKDEFKHNSINPRYEQGGSLGNHGLKQGDQIIKTMSGGVQKVKTKSGDIVYVNLANGYRGAEPPLPFAKGGGVEKRSLKSVIHLVDWKGEGIKKWYLRSYPKDEMGEELNDTVTFKDLWDALNEKKDVYEIIGVGDSLIRERLFEYLALLYNVDYDVVYKKWLESDDYAKGGYTNERRHVNKAQDYEVRYAKNKPNTTGYLGKRSFDEGGISNGRYEVVKVIGFDKNGKTLPKNEIKVIADFDSRKEALNFVYEQQFKKDVTQRDIFIRDTKTNKTFAEGGFMTDPNFGDFQNGVYKYGGEVEYAIKGYKEYTEKLWKGDDYFSEKYAVNELAELELDLRKLNDGYLSPSKVVGKGYKNAKKVAQDWLNEQIKKQKSIIETRGLSNRTNQSNFRSELRFALNENMISEEKFNTLIDESNEIIDSLGETYATGGVTKNYINRNQLNTITIKKGDQKLTYKVSDVYNGAYKLEEGGNLEKTAFYVPKRNVVKVQLKDGKDVKVANGYWIKKGAKPIHTSKYDDGGMTEKEFMQKEINSQKEIEKGKVFKKYRVNVYENGFPFVEPLMTDNLLEAINFAKKTIEEQRKYRASSKDLFAEISEFTPIEKRDNVRYAYNRIGSLSEEDLKSSKYEDGGQLEMKFLKGGKLESKIQKKVDEVNSLIEKAIDKDGDPIMVVDKSGTWEEPMQYKPIVYKNGRLYFEYYEPYSGKTQKEVVNKSNIEFDGYPMLLDIAKMYRSALKQKGVSFAGGGNLNYGIPKEDLENYKIEEVLKDIVDIDYDNSNLEKSKYIILAKPINNNYKNNWYEPKVFIITEKGIYTISNVKKSKWEEIKKDIFDNELTFEKYGYFKIMLNGGKTTFKEKATAIAKKFEGKKVEPKYQKEYGKTYDKAEAKEVGNKIAGSQKAKYDAKMSKGGSTKRGGAMVLAKQIRKEGESWASALKRANEQMRNK